MLLRLTRAFLRDSLDRMNGTATGVAHVRVTKPLEPCEVLVIDADRVVRVSRKSKLARDCVEIEIPLTSEN